MFLSVTAGQGHNQAAKGIMQRMTERGHTCKLIDTLDYIDPMLGEAVDKGFRATVAYTPKAYGKAYNMAQRAEARFEATTRVTQMLSDVACKRLLDVFESFAPDVVICTHCMAAQIASSIYSMGKCNAARIGILTDYTLHPYWLGVNLDALVTPSEQLHYGIMQAGMPEHTLYATGIPIHPKFLKKIGKTEARAQVGIPDMPTVLVMGGSMGNGDVVSTIERLDMMPLDFQMVVVCGSNEKLKNKLDEMLPAKRLTVLGFANNVDVLMSASDLIVTKPGGLTVSESIAKQLPMVLVDPIPGQEERNMDFLTNHGMAMRTSKYVSVDAVVYQLLTSPHLREMILHAQVVFGKPNATDDLQALIESLGARKMQERQA